MCTPRMCSCAFSNCSSYEIRHGSIFQEKMQANILQNKVIKKIKERTETCSLNVSFSFVFRCSPGLPAMPSWSHVICIKHCLHLTLFCPRGALQINSMGFTELWQLFFDPLCCLLTLLGMFKPSLKWMATLIMLSLLLWLLNSPQTIITGKIRALHSQN